MKQRDQNEILALESTNSILSTDFIFVPTFSFLSLHFTLVTVSEIKSKKIKSKKSVNTGCEKWCTNNVTIDVVQEFFKNIHGRSC